jgi:hypothetical protein
MLSWQAWKDRSAVPLASVARVFAITGRGVEAPRNTPFCYSLRHATAFGAGWLDEFWSELVDSWISSATNAVAMLPCAKDDGSNCLSILQVTTRSPMGAIAYSTGGLLIENGWVRGGTAPLHKGVCRTGRNMSSKSLISWSMTSAECFRVAANPARLSEFYSFCDEQSAADPN